MVQGAINKLRGREFISKQLLLRVTFFYCSDSREPSQMSGFQSLPSLALYCLATGSLLVVWAVHTLYQPVRKEGKGKLDLNGETDLQLSKGQLVPCGRCLLQEKVSGEGKDSSFQDPKN